MHTLLLSLLLAAGCGSAGVKLGDPTTTTPTVTESDADVDADGDTDADTDSDTDGDTDADTDTDSLPDVSEQMDPDASRCATYYGERRAGAKGYWWATFAGNQDDGWSTEVHWTLFANDTWIADGGADCEVVWSAWSDPGHVNYCADCDLGVVVQGFVDRGATSCAEEIWFNYQTIYWYDEVRLRDGGHADWYTYGYSVGSGYWRGETVEEMNLLGAASCVWF